MDGVLVLDKPEGITSHDVVAAARRLTGERRIGHTGTLDPLATGVLPLACGRATRLVRFLSAADKEYVTVIRLGLATDSYDITGRETSRSNTAPVLEDVARAIDALCGERLQLPPPFSAKKVGGHRAYDLARADRSPHLTAARVRLDRVEIASFTGTHVTVALTCSAGFYVRSFAHELGERVGVGACVERLRRVRSGEFTLAQTVSLDRLQGAAPLPLGALLPGFPSVSVTVEGAERVSHGRELELRHCDGRWPAGADGWVRILGPDRELLALGRPAGTALHPAVVLT